MNLKNYNDYACFEYISTTCNLVKLGDVVIRKYDEAGNLTNEIGVIIQVHGNGEYRTDKFGNCDISEIKKATKKQIAMYRPNILLEGQFIGAKK